MLDQGRTPPIDFGVKAKNSKCPSASCDGRFFILISILFTIAPVYVSEVVKKIAEIKEMDYEEVRVRLIKNAVTFFNLT